MIVSGRVSRKMAPVLRRIYDQMPEPKWVISMGACATSGGVFDNYAIVQGVDKIVPVDVYIPGCPPRPEMLIHAVMMLQDKVMKESVRDRRDVPEDEAREAVTPGTCRSPTDRPCASRTSARITALHDRFDDTRRRRSFLPRFAKGQTVNGLNTKPAGSRSAATPATPNQDVTTPSQLVTALQREHPEWVTEIVEALSARSRSSFRASTSSTVCAFLKSQPGDSLIFWPTFAASIAGRKKSRASKSTIICFRPRSSSSPALESSAERGRPARADRDRSLANSQLARARNFRSVRRDLRRTSGFATHSVARRLARPRAEKGFSVARLRAVQPEMSCRVQLSSFELQTNPKLENRNSN